MLGLWKGLTRFLDDPRIALDNNATERALRGMVIGRKNHYAPRGVRLDSRQPSPRGAPCG
jgi:transposase